MPLANKIINGFQWSKQYLMRRFDNKEVDEATYKKEYNELQTQINVETNRLLDEYKKEEVIEKSKKEDEKMSEKNEEAPKKIGRKPGENSTATLIMKALMQKGVKDVDAAIEKVCSAKEGLEKAKVKTQIATIIRETEKGKGRWKNYTWNKEQYLLSEK